MSAWEFMDPQPDSLCPCVPSCLAALQSSQDID